MIKHKNTFIKNIYYMLCYAFTNLKFGDMKDISAEEFENIHNLFSKILSEGIGKQLKQGLYREYINRTENISNLRGKINLNGTIKNFLCGRKILSCNYDELSENNLLNQILKTTANLFLHNENVRADYKKILRQEMLFFSEVETITPNLIAWNKIRFVKDNQRYHLLINLCRLILNGMILTTDDGKYRLKSFLDDRNFEILYEKFLLEYYRKHFLQLNPRASQISWAIDEGEKYLLPKMRSDVILSQGKNLLIIDAKFYSNVMQNYFGTQKLHSHNLYQIFTYVKNKSAMMKNSKVSGLLLYAKTDEKFQPNISYNMSGNKISVKTLDLNKNFSDIALQLNEIAKDI